MSHRFNILADKQTLEKDRGFINYKNKQYFFKKCNEDLCYRELNS